MPSDDATKLVPADYVPDTIDLNNIALELAQGWYSDEQIRQAHGLSIAQWQMLANDAPFVHLCGR